MILSEEKLEQLLCKQLKLDSSKPYSFSTSFGLIWAETSYDIFAGQNFHSLWHGKVEQNGQCFCFVCRPEAEEAFILPSGVFDFEKTMPVLGVFLNNRYYCLIVGTDGRQRIIPKSNLNWNSIRREHYYGDCIVPRKGNLVCAESQKKKFLAWVYYDDDGICSFFNIEDSQWLEPSEVREWSFELRKKLFWGETEYRCEDKCLVRCETQ